MKFFTSFVVAAIAGLAAAQSQCLSTAAAIPSCGQSCLTAAGSSFGCAFTDFACQCSHSSQINNGQLSSCVLSACGGQSALAVSSQAVAVCSCVAANGGAAKATAITSSAVVPVTTAAIGAVGTPAKATSSAKSAAVTLATKATQTAKVSQFTGGAPNAVGSVGGVLAAILGVIAAL